MNNNHKPTFFQYVAATDNKWTMLLAIAAGIGFTWNLLRQEGEGQYMESTAFWLWVGFGLAFPLLILFLTIRSYRDHLKGKSR